MASIKTRYLGDLKVECEHLQSGTKIITEAPVDNFGKGESFSPTDLFATALGSCILTTMGIFAHTMGMQIEGAQAEVSKIMGDKPRHVAQLEVVVQMPDKNYTDKEKKTLERAALSCAVHNTLEGSVEMNIQIHWAH
ncbi:MAG: OsmC family protein [Bacteroidales bacterium]